MIKMAKRKGSAGSNEQQFIATQANLDKKGKTNKKLKTNPMASKYLSVKGRELKETTQAMDKENKAKARERKAKLAKAS